MTAEKSSCIGHQTSLEELETKHGRLKEKAGNYAEEQLSLKKRIEQLNDAQKGTMSQIAVACYNDRKTRQIAAVRKDFENTLREMGKENLTKPLPVFCAASTTFLKYQNKNFKKKCMGFPTKQETEIPQLRDWLTKFTLDNREKNAQAFLQDVEQLIASMKPWIDDKRGDLKIYAAKRKQWEPALQARIKELNLVCSIFLDDENTPGRV